MATDDSESMVEERVMRAEAAMEDNNDADNSDTSSTDSSDDEAIDIPAEQLEKLMALEGELEANMNLYDKHIEYIDLLRQLKLRDRLRKAHEAMASRFPLTEQLWLDWVNDELEQVRSAEDVEHIKQLFRRATEDYLSIELWSQYLDFIAELDPEVRAATPKGIQLMRDTCEAALTAGGLHVTQGSRLWATYRGFEKGLLAALTGASGSGDSKEADKQAEVVRSLYQRQLQVPLAGNAEVLEEYKAWEEARAKAVPAHILKAAEKAQDAASLRKTYEEAVAPGKEADAALLAAYLSYVKLEQAQGNPARVQVVYERAVATFPVTVELWVQYCRYLGSKLQGVPAVCARVAVRAARNCYWSGSLWATAIRAADRAGQDGPAIRQLAAQAVAAGLQSGEDYLEVLLAELDALRHRLPAQGAGSSPAAAALRAAFQQATDLMAQYFPDYVDRTLRLPGYWAHCEAHVLGDVQAARKVWEAALKTDLAKYVEVWSAYGSMERSLRHLSEARAVYRTAAAKKLEESGQYFMCMEWLRFEREEGSADTYITAADKVTPILDEYAAASAAATADQQTKATAKAAAKKAAALSPEEVKRKRQQNDPNFKGGKASKQAAGKGATPGGAKRPADKGAQEDEGPTKRARKQGPEGTTHAAAQQGEQQDTDMQPASAEGSKVVQGADVEMQPAGQHAGAQDEHAEPSHHAAFNLEHSVFVRGLPPDIKPETLEHFFRDCGPIVAVRIPKFPDGKPRNFGYVDFDTEEALMKAVAKDGSHLPDTSAPLSIAKSAPPPAGGRGRGRGRGFRGRGWGDGRGHAPSGEHAMPEVHGRGGHRGRGHEAFRGASKLLGLGHAGRGVNTRHPKAHLQLDADTPTPGEPAPVAHPAAATMSMMPRSVAVAQHKAAGGEGGERPAAAADEDMKPRSNADFRAMLLSGKK